MKNILKHNTDTSTKLKKIREQASEWCVALSDDNVDEATHEAFNKWYQMDALNQQVFQKTARVWDGLATLQHLDRTPLQQDND